jgi:hypothetical protein
MIMKGIFLTLCGLLVLGAAAHAEEIMLPAGARIDGTAMFGTFAPAETAAAQSLPLSVRATQNPISADGREFPLKDCIIMGEVVADVTVNRAFFRASRIICANSKEPGGNLVKGYVVDHKDNKLGIQGVKIGSTPVTPTTPAATSATQRYVETPGGAKVTFYTLEGIIIHTK